MTRPLIRPSGTFSPQAGRRFFEPPRPAQRGEGRAKRQVRGRVPAWLGMTLLVAAVPLLAQQQPTPPPAEPPPHDISMVDPAPLGGAIAVPLSEAQRKQLRKYDVPELAGSRQALGSQLVDGALPRPLIDYVARDSNVEQRLSIFQGGLVVVSLRGTGGPIRKRLIIPDDALQSYRKRISPSALDAVRPGDLARPRENRNALLRVYSADGKYVERSYDPMAALPKALSDQIVPLRDLLRTISEDRTVTNSVANYMPKPGDHLVGDDRKVYLVKRVIDDRIVELRCMTQPTTIYVAVKDLYNYFIGTTGAAEQ